MSHYLFIDGAYLREAYSKIMNAYYGEVPPVDYSALAGVFGAPLFPADLRRARQGRCSRGADASSWCARSRWS
jgi:hypothetical protein